LQEDSVSVLLPVLLVFSLFAFFFPCPTPAQENPYIVAYDHYLEEPGNLEIEYVSTFGTQRAGNDFHAFWVEFEYGATAWWTTEFYVDAQSTFGDSTIFTGVRWENRIRFLKREHFINPVLYVEYEHKNGADKILKEGEGHDVESDFLTSNAEARRDRINEIELKLILSSTFKGWNFTENTLAAKDLSNSPWGLAMPSVRVVPSPLRLLPSVVHFAARTSARGPRCTAASGTVITLACATRLTTLLPLWPGICLRAGRQVSERRAGLRRAGKGPPKGARQA
jgi:hypothetical protein